MTLTESDDPHDADYYVFKRAAVEEMYGVSLNADMVNEAGWDQLKRDNLYKHDVAEHYSRPRGERRTVGSQRAERIAAVAVMRRPFFNELKCCEICNVCERRKTITSAALLQHA